MAGEDGMPHKRQHAAFCGTLPAAAYTPLSCAAQGLGNLPAVLLFTLRRSVSKGYAGNFFLDIWSLFYKACPVYYALQPAYKQLFAGFRLLLFCCKSVCFSCRDSFACGEPAAFTKASVKRPCGTKAASHAWQFSRYGATLRHKGAGQRAARQ